MSLAVEIRHRAGAVNRRLLQTVLESPGLPAHWARRFGAVHGAVMERAYSLPIAQMRVDPRHMLTRLLQAGDVMLDVGASTGLTAAIASRRVGPRGWVFAFEPQEGAYAELDAKRRRFGWTNVVTSRTLVGEESGQATLYQHPSNSEISSLSAGWNRGEGVPVRHPMRALDDWMAESAVDRVDLVKIDVEGAELGVLRGARALLEAHRPALLIEINNRPRRLELFGYTVDDLLAELRERGYQRFERLRPRGLGRFEAEADLDDADRDMLAR